MAERRKKEEIEELKKRVRKLEEEKAAREETTKEKEERGKPEKEKGVRIEGIFSGVGKMVSSLLNLTDKMMKEGKEVAEREGEVEGKIGGKPARISYGYRVGIGLRPGAEARAKAREEEFKPYTIRKAKEREEKIEEWKPFLDIFEKLNEIKVVAELPKAVKKKDIKIEVSGDKLKIITPRYSREAQLPCSVGNWNFKLYKTKREAVLEIRLRKKKRK